MGFARRLIAVVAGSALVSLAGGAWAQEEPGKKAEEHGKAGDEHGKKAEEHGKAGDEHGKAGEAHGKAGEGHGEHGKAGEAHGEHHHEGRLEVSYTERPLTMPRMILAPEGEIAVEHASPLTSLALGLSARFGITDDFEISALVAPLSIGPFGGPEPLPGAPAESKFHYGNPRVGATYRFLRGKFELGATLGVTIVHERSESEFATPAFAVQSGAIIEPGAVFRLHISKEALLEGGAFIPIEFGSAGADGAALGLPTSGVGLRVPLAFAYDIIEPLHVGVRSGLGIASFSPGGESTASDALYIPFGIFAGYAIGGKNGPVLDIDPFFTWPALLTPGSQAHGLTPATTTHAGEFSAGVALGGFLYL